MDELASDDVNDGADLTDARFVERIAQPLRAPERLVDSFESRVMAAAYASGRAGSRRPRIFSGSPLKAAAMAAGLIGTLLLGDAAVRMSLASRRESAVAPLPPTAVASGITRDTVHVVRFVFMDSHARTIAVVGDFNGWDKRATELVRTPNGKAWIVSVTLTPGRHEYAFVVEDEKGEHWVADPAAATLHDDFGTESSVVQVGGERAHSAADAS